MSSMRERIIAALIDRIGSPWSWENAPPEVRGLWIGHADAVLEAMREPDEAMLAAGNDCDDDYENDNAISHWRAMIDAARAP